VPELVAAFVLFAPGIADVAVITSLSRAMFAVGRLKITVAGVAGSWLLVIAASVLLAELMPAHLVVAALALGNTIGQTAVAIPMVIATRRIRGPAAVQGIGHATVSGLAAGRRAPRRRGGLPGRTDGREAAGRRRGCARGQRCGHR
jgi:putative peptidoglycan lipid II flippase